MTKNYPTNFTLLLYLYFTFTLILTLDIREINHHADSYRCFHLFLKVDTQKGEKRIIIILTLKTN
jgi:hypothetical protein